MTSSSQDLMRGFHFFPVEYAHPMFLIDLFFCCAKYGKSKSKSRSKLINFWWFEIALASQKIVVMEEGKIDELVYNNVVDIIHFRFWTEQERAACYFSKKVCPEQS